MFSNEFFRQRSYEVVWAVFRVAGRVGREKIKTILEDRALDFFKSKDIESLLGLEDAVKLGADLEEISKINSGVLFREISRLKSILEDYNIAKLRAVKDMAEKNKGGLNDLDVEGIFSRPPMLLSEFMSKIANKDRGLAKGADLDHGPSSNAENAEIGGSLNSEVNSSNAPVYSRVEKNNAENAEKVLPISNNAENAESSNMDSKKAIKTIDLVSQIGGFGINSSQRKEMMISVLKSKILCRMGDFAVVMPKVSTRTLRYDLKELIEEGAVERVGSGGPSAFIRLKKSKKS